MSLQHFEIDGGTLAVEVRGNGPLVICSPGMGDTRDSYGPLSDRLVARGYKVAVMDYRGAGDSSVHFNRYGDEATADDFIMLATKLGNNNAPALLIGNSFSGGSAAIAAAKRPELVAGIVLNAPFLRNPNAWGQYAMPVLFARPWGAAVWKAYAKTLWPGLGDREAAERAAASKQSLTRPGRWAAFQKLVSSLDHSVVPPYLPNARATPALVLMGDSDPDWSDPLKEAEWVASNFSDVESVTLKGVGHGPQFERPEVVGEAVIKFLDRLQVKGTLH